MDIGQVRDIGQIGMRTGIGRVTLPQVRARSLAGAGMSLIVAMVLLGGCSRLGDAAELFAEAIKSETGTPAGTGGPAENGGADEAPGNSTNPESPAGSGDAPSVSTPGENPAPGEAVPAPDPGKPLPPIGPVERPSPETPAPETPAPGTPAAETAVPETAAPAAPESPATPAPTPADTPAQTPAQAPAGTPRLPIVFQYHPSGELLPNSGTGSRSAMNFAPDMRFPIASHATYLGSQVYRPGGGLGPKDKPDQCDASNFSFPWQDNFCERRTRDTTNPFCPAKGVHLGQDIRAGDPGLCRKILRTPRAERREIPVVAVEDGIISNIGSYTVTLRTERNTYRYLHLNMAALAVKNNEDVKAGDLIGFLSNDFGVDSAGKPVPTTLHLHFEIRANTESFGWATVPPYPALVASYERREMGRGEEITAKTAAAGN